jgi:cytochrome c oxidase cbb3-type subunit 3
VRSAYDENAWAISQGKLLYESMNCAGCHSAGGGGGMGPALIDSLWIYGAAPENIFQTIVEGRPDGMPAYRGRLGNAEVWKLVAYVRSMAALTPSDTRSGRGDQMHGTVTTPQADSVAPMRDRIPPEEQVPVPEAAP